MFTRFMVAKNMRDNADSIEDMLIEIFLDYCVICDKIARLIGR